MKKNDLFVFVFGSNLAGRHGKGAAKHALEEWGAIYGDGEGIQGNSYAIPTKDEFLRTRSLEEIKLSILKFLDYASFAHSKLFLVTPVGTGLAGYSKKQVAELFYGIDIPPNVVFTREWFQ